MRERGKAYRDRQLVMLVLDNDLAWSRFGFVTSKRLGNAVRRNRIRRIMREAARSYAEELRRNSDVVLIAVDPVGMGDLSTVRRSLQRLGREAGLLD